MKVREFFEKNSFSREVQAAYLREVHPHGERLSREYAYQLVRAFPGRDSKYAEAQFDAEVFEKVILSLTSYSSTNAT